MVKEKDFERMIFMNIKESEKSNKGCKAEKSNLIETLFSSGFPILHITVFSPLSKRILRSLDVA